MCEDYDDALEVYQDLNLNSSVIARPVTGADIELGEATVLEGREWLEAKVGDIAGYVLAPNARGHTTLGGHTTFGDDWVQLAKSLATEATASPEPTAVAAFVGEMYYSYYERKWASLDSRNRHSWNWAAFFFGPFWLAYRKMYSHAGAFLSSIVALTILSLVFKWQPQSSTGYSAAVSFCIARLGNYWYKEHVIKRLATAGPVDVDPLAEEGGEHLSHCRVYGVALRLFHHCSTSSPRVILHRRSSSRKCRRS